MRRRRSALLAAAADALAIVVFVSIGRRTHDEGLAGTGRVAAPFLLAAAAAWIGLRAWRRPLDVRSTGVPLWIVTVGGGMLLRRMLFGDGTALPFVLVASVTVGSFLVGWRALVRVVGPARG